MPPVLAAQERVTDAGRGIAGRLDDDIGAVGRVLSHYPVRDSVLGIAVVVVYDVYSVGRYEILGIVHDAGIAVAHGLLERAGSVTFHRPPDTGAGLARASAIQVRDADDMDAGRARRLR
jgi:hypothetical protein